MSAQSKILVPLMLGEWKEHYQPLTIGILVHMRWRLRLEAREEVRNGTIKQLEAKTDGRKWLQEAREVGAHIAEGSGRTGIRTHVAYHDMQWKVTEFGTVTREYFTTGAMFGFPILPEDKNIQVLRLPGVEVVYRLSFGGKAVRWEFGPGSKWVVRRGKHPFRRRLPTRVIISFG